MMMKNMDKISDCSFADSLLVFMSDIKDRKQDAATIKQQVSDFLKQANEQENLDPIVRRMLLFIGLNNFLPPCYDKFQPPLIEGMIFLLCKLPLSRLAQKITDQMLLPTESSQGHRVYVLINDMPTLQKLCQIICRSPGLAPEFKTALTDLEDNVKTVSYQSLLPTIQKELDANDPDYRFSTEKNIMAEASVCAVVAAEVRESGEEVATQAVLKFVKPAVKRNLPQELELIDQLADFLDQNKKNWEFGEFRFRDTFEQVRRLLENETDLSSEQRNLDKVANYYRTHRSVRVPERLHCSTDGMTVMTRVEGNKITDVADLTRKQRQRLAAALVKTCILNPIRDLKEESLFHGDPHAGNIAYRFQKGKPHVILYDWGMMGKLSRLQRFSLMLMVFGILTKNEMAIFYAADILARLQISSDSDLSYAVKRSIAKTISNRNERTKGVLSTIERLIEEMTYCGVIFPTDLLMFEKALVTLKGVQNDIDPTFDRDDYLFWAALRCFWTDVFKLRLHRLALEEIWNLYRFSLCRLMDLQRLIFKIGLEFGLFCLRLPLDYKLAGH
jgi:ubiquinone biosynthesis protein